MKTPTVILHTDNPEASKAVLEKKHPDLPIWTCSTYEGLAGLVSETGAEVVYSVRFNGSQGFPRDVLVSSESVRWVSVAGSGTDHLAPWDSDHVAVTNAAGVAADMMAQYVLGVMLHFSLGFPTFRAAQTRQEWLIGEVEPIDGKTVLILGLGRTGQAVAARSKLMGLKTLGVRANPKDTPHVDEVHSLSALGGLWERADFLVACVPLLESTRGLVNETAFDHLKPSTVVIDVSRGGVIKESALISALDSGKIRGAGLDVFRVEPLAKGHRLWDYENVIITPHCSAVYAGWDLKSVEMFAENLTRYRQGQALWNIVDPARGY